MTKVYVPQIPSRFDQQIKRWVPVMNLDPAKQFGDIEILLPPDGGRIPAKDITQIIAKGLKPITPQDWLLAIGDPLAIGVMMIYAARYLNGELRVLRWDKRSSQYHQLTVSL